MRLLAVAWLAACGGTAEPTGFARIERSDLRALLGVTDVAAVGVTVDPSSGRRLVLDSSRGVFDVRTGDVVVSFDDLAIGSWSRGFVPVLHDVAAAPDGRLLLAGETEGYLYVPGASEIPSHYCVVPETPGIRRDTEAVAVDGTRILAQVRVLDESSSVFLRSVISQFDLETGDRIGDVDLDDPSFLGGGMLVEADGDLLLGRDADVYRIDPDVLVPEPVLWLGRHGVRDIQGLGYDGASDSYLVLDADDDEILEIARTEMR